MTTKYAHLHMTAPLKLQSFISVITGAQLKVSFSHQLALTEFHLRLAAELHRPVSMHCVRAYGERRSWRLDAQHS